MTTAQTRVALILVHYQSETETVACLESLQSISLHGIEAHIIVVDNGSKSPLVVPDEKLPPQTRIVRSDTNLGFTDGNNLGITIAQKEFQPDYILLLNNDTTVSPDFLEHLVTEAKEHPEVGMLVPKIYFSPGREFHAASYTAEQRGHVLWFAGGSIDWNNLDAFHRGVDEVDRGQFDHRHDTAFVTGCCVLLPTSVIDRVGMLDSKYFLYLEDVDWSMRIKRAGYQLRFVPQSVIWHQNAGSSGGSGSLLHLYYQTRNRLYFFLTYAGQHIFPEQKRPKAKHFLRFIWFQLRVIKLGLRSLFSPQRTVRQAALDWLLGRMGKQAVY